MLRCEPFLSSILLSILALSLVSPALSNPKSQLSRPNPNTDRFPQPIPTPQPLPTDPPALTPTPSETPKPNPSTITIPVRKIEIIGNTVFKPAEIQKITQSIEGQSVTLEQLQNVADSMTQLYLNRGYITSRAVLVDQAIADGVVQIRVIEGSVEKIEIQGLQRLLESYVRDRIKLGTSTPLNKDNLEDQLRLLKADPLFDSVEASLKAGNGIGQSILTLRVREAKQFSGFVGADNLSPPSVGSERIGTVLNYRNLTGLGDEISASYYRSTQGGSNSFDFNYRIPVNAMNGAVQLRVSPSRSKIIEPQFADFGIRSETDLYELSYRQPLIRTTREEFALSIAFAMQNGQTFLFQDTPFPFGIGADIDGNTRTRILKFGQDYVRRDTQGAWVARSQFSLGLNLFNATTNDSPVPDGRFFSWLGQLQRVQRLGNDHLLILQADFQLTPDSLLPSQQFVIGGGQWVRGYRQNARSGDNGFRLSIEDRITVQRNPTGAPVLQFAPFIDAGTVWNRSNNPNVLPDQRFLAGGGLGVILEPTPRLQLRADYAIPFSRLSDRGNNAQDKAFYFSVGYSF
ncbi:MAG: ShlB/FhaC/HecB family hemolysin secretion/activation protein [Plectolyngbya sp. WJT66-NPBG17]|jgi:hemolysin activation/secretion protein|nr:ShlB/FhaC/HecB family hemolysin secretion/activation protein [Plectolyngbya sp. WJT66-NPBG17]